MKITTIIDPSREEEITIVLQNKSELPALIENLVSENSVELIGYTDKLAQKLEIADINCFVVENNKIYAITSKDKFQLKNRLYRIEQILPSSFVKINQSCIANLKQIKKFDTSISGTLHVIFKCGYSDYVSRRNLKNVKERLGL
ncbi:MAG: LytTR family transcriptional regulator [Clostridia bacterium]|nr:LytTR family transcriptional regulator [Clostridia bacterium]